MVSKSLYPFQANWWHRGDLKLHYLDEGEGHPVVMVHGNPTWSFYYRELVKALRPQYRCIVPDHIGCGYSDKPSGSNYGYRLENRIADLEGLLASLAISENITLIVHDWGGMIGMGYAVCHPESIRRLVILNTGAFHLPQTKSFPAALRLGRDTWLGGLLIRGGNAFCRAAAHVCVKRRPLPKAVKKAYLAPYDTWKNRIATLRFVQDIPLMPGDPSFAEVDRIATGLSLLAHIPMLICWGLRDFVFSEQFLLEWEKRFPRAKVHRFPDCGHYILEDAIQEIRPLVTEFIEEPALRETPV